MAGSLKTFLNVTRIAMLKAEARKEYKAYQEACDSMDCGTHLAEVISTEVAVAKSNFNHLMDDLAKIDPTTPKGRL